MEMESLQIIDNRAKSQWLKSSISFDNYQKYIDIKETRFHLTFIDLLYVSNFKGGNATINEPENEINIKLKRYSAFLKELFEKFQNKSLNDLNTLEIDDLILSVQNFFNNTVNTGLGKINGFATSYISTLLNMNFPKLIPILDRRVLINLKLVNDKDIDKQGQIKNLLMFYKPLILKMASISKNSGESIREIDYRIFILKLET